MKRHGKLHEYFGGIAEKTFRDTLEAAAKQFADTLRTNDPLEEGEEFNRPHLHRPDEKDPGSLSVRYCMCDSRQGKVIHQVDVTIEEFLETSDDVYACWEEGEAFLADLKAFKRAVELKISELEREINPSTSR